MADIMVSTTAITEGMSAVGVGSEEDKVSIVRES